jgi:O-antigen biosynthesis rhamnosyltransferase
MDGYELFTAKRNFELASNGFSLQSIQLYKKLASKADLIHYHFPWPFADLIHLLLAPPKKTTVLTYHSDIIRQKFLLKLYRPLQYQFLKSVDHIVATSPNYLKTSDVLPA